MMTDENPPGVRRGHLDVVWSNAQRSRSALLRLSLRIFKRKVRRFLGGLGQPVGDVAKISAIAGDRGNCAS
jgi:hypothetical protein